MINIKKNDCFVVSIPFSDSGGLHPQTEETLKKCDDIKIPVLVDSAISMAKVTPEDPFASLAEIDTIATSWPKLKLLDKYEPNLTTKDVDLIFNDVKDHLIPFITKINQNN